VVEVEATEGEVEVDSATAAAVVGLAAVAEMAGVVSAGTGVDSEAEAAVTAAADSGVGTEVEDSAAEVEVATVAVEGGLTAHQGVVTAPQAEAEGGFPHGVPRVEAGGIPRTMGAARLVTTVHLIKVVVVAEVMVAEVLIN
jgi:hypothetical protein